MAKTYWVFQKPEGTIVVLRLIPFLRKLYPRKKVEILKKTAKSIYLAGEEGFVVGKYLAKRIPSKLKTYSFKKVFESESTFLERLRNRKCL